MPAETEKFQRPIRNYLIAQAIFGVLLLLLTCLGLLLPPRQIFLWLPSLLILLVLLFIGTSLLAFDHGYRFENRRNLSIAISTDVIALIFLVLSIFLLIWGATTKFTRLELVIPLILLAICQLLLCGWVIYLAARLSKTVGTTHRNDWSYKNGTTNRTQGVRVLPIGHDQSISQTSTMQKSTIGSRSDSAAPPSYSEAVSMSEININEAGETRLSQNSVAYGNPTVHSAYSTGSVNTMYTMTSDL